jgi:hypothetical protein
MTTTQLVLLVGEDFTKRDVGFIHHLAIRELMPTLKAHRSYKMDLTKVDIKACHVNDDPLIYGPNYVYVRMNVEFIK